MTGETTSDSQPVGTQVRPEDLPPVEPPSAGFIIQLFVVPALIVAAVIGVWALFGRLADSDTDWKQLVADVGSSNEHRRWRSAEHLANLLRNEQIGTSSEDEKLADNEEVAQALCKLLDDSLNSPSTLDEDIVHRKFLALTLGSLRCDDVVLPTLAKTLDNERDAEVRKSGLMGVVMIAGRAFDKAARATGATPVIAGNNEEVLNLSAPLESPSIANEKIMDAMNVASKDDDASIRHLAAYGFGLISGPESIKQLKYMLMDRDELTRANAAVGLARNGVTDAGQTLTELLDEQLQEIDRDTFQKLSPKEQQQALETRKFERPTVVRLCLRAATNIYASIDDSQQAELKRVITALAEDDDPSIKLEAQSALDSIAGGK